MIDVIWAVNFNYTSFFFPAKIRSGRFFPNYPKDNLLGFYHYGKNKTKKTRYSKADGMARFPYGTIY